MAYFSNKLMNFNAANAKEETNIPIISKKRAFGAPTLVVSIALLTAKHTDHEEQDKVVG